MNCVKVWLIAGLLIIAGISGCDARIRYRLFSPIFDGVPNPDDKKLEYVRQRDRSSKSKTSRYQYGEHGPYAAKMCEGCHQRGTNKLILPLDQLCLHCHELKLGNKKIHGPLAAGDCTVCHDAHSSPNRYLLVSDSKEFCVHCHDKNEVMQRDVHREMQHECTVCHDAHASANDFLLK